MTEEQLIKLVDDKIEEVHKANLINLTKIKDILNIIFTEEHNQIKIISDIKDKILKSVKNSIDIEQNADKNILFRLDREFNYYLGNNVTLYQIIIFFPEIIITNSDKQSHKIEELYFIINLTKDLYFRNISGLRTKMTDIESNVAYRHSHLSSGYLDSSFCLGEGPLRILRALLQSEFDIDNFTMFCHSIRPYLEWESIEGGPHKLMKNIFKESNISETNLNLTFIKKLSVLFLKSNEFKQLIHTDLIITFNELINIEFTDNFRIQFASYIQNLIKNNSSIQNEDLFRGYHNQEYRSELIVCKKESGEYFDPNGVNKDTEYIQAADLKKVIINFKGEDKFLKIIPTTVKSINLVYYAHPGIIKRFKQTIEQLCNDYLYTNSSSSWIKSNINIIEEVTESN